MLGIIMTVLMINNGFQAAYINLNEIQALEVVDIDDDSGILTITLKGDKEAISFKCNDKEKWHQTREFLEKSIFDISRQMNRNDYDVKLNKDQF